MKGPDSQLSQRLGMERQRRELSSGEGMKRRLWEIVSGTGRRFFWLV